MTKLYRIAALLAIPLLCQAAGVSVGVSQVGMSDTWVVTYTWAADSAGSVPVTASQNLPAILQGYWPVSVETVPATPAPTSAYSVQVLDGSGTDILSGQAGSLSATASQAWSVASSIPPLNGVLSLKLTGNSVSGAQGIVYVFLSKVKARFGLSQVVAGGTVTHTSGALTSGLPVIGNAGADITVGTKSGNTTDFATVGSLSANSQCSGTDASNNLITGVCGTVTSVSWPTIPSWLTVNITSPTTAASIAVTPTTAQTTHQVIGTCGSGTTFAPCALVAGDLPATVVFTNTTNTFTGFNDFHGATGRLFESIVGSLPSASASTNWVFVVTDGTSASDCTVGGASTRALCISNGATWVALGGGGGSTYTSLTQNGNAQLIANHSFSVPDPAAPAFSATPTIDLALCQICTMPNLTANVTAVTFTHKVSGKFEVLWPQPTSGGTYNYTVTYGASVATGTPCQITVGQSVTTDQHLTIDGSGNVTGDFCTDNSTYKFLRSATDIAGVITGTAGGTANAQIVTPTPPIGSLTNALNICWIPTNNNTNSTPTLSVSGLTAATIVRQVGGGVLAANDLSTSALACVYYDGTNFELTNPQTGYGGGLSYAPNGVTPYGGLGAGAPYTVSPTNNQMSYTPVVVPAPGWNVTSVGAIVNSSTSDAVTACFYDSTGTLLTNGQGTTVTTGGNLTISSPAFTSLNLAGGLYYIGWVSHNTGGTTTFYTGAFNNDGGWGQAVANQGKGSSSYAYFRGPSGANLATGTTTLLCPASAGTRTVVSLIGGGIAVNSPAMSVN